MYGLALAFMASLSLIGCGMSLHPGSAFQTPQVEKMRTTDETKLIVNGLSDGNNPATYMQPSYTLNGERRLLLKRTDFLTNADKIIVVNGGKVVLRVTLIDQLANERAIESLSLCPLTTDWMLLATWDRAHPFSKRGLWRRAGGDYDEASCVHPVAENPLPKTELAKDTDVAPAHLYFDVSEWFLDYAQGRGVDLGFVLKTGIELEIYGDASGPYSPRIYWNE